jgi:hypothetical protein
LIFILQWWGLWGIPRILAWRCIIRFVVVAEVTCLALTRSLVAAERSGAPAGRALVDGTLELDRKRLLAPTGADATDGVPSAHLGKAALAVGEVRREPPKEGHNLRSMLISSGWLSAEGEGTSRTAAVDWPISVAQSGSTLHGVLVREAYGWREDKQGDWRHFL